MTNPEPMGRTAPPRMEGMKRIPQPRRRPVVVIESPYKGDIEKNRDFAKAVCRHYVLSGFNPFASHLFYPAFLDDEDHNERFLGMDLGLTLLAPDLVVFALPIGESLSDGMSRALDVWRRRDVPIVLTRWEGDKVIYGEPL